MLSQEHEVHIVNMASFTGLISTPGLAIYGSSKHALVRISEALIISSSRSSDHRCACRLSALRACRRGSRPHAATGLRAFVEAVKTNSAQTSKRNLNEPSEHVPATIRWRPTRSRTRFSTRLDASNSTFCPMRTLTLSAAA